MPRRQKPKKASKRIGAKGTKKSKTAPVRKSGEKVKNRETEAVKRRRKTTVSKPGDKSATPGSLKTLKYKIKDVKNTEGGETGR